MPRVRNRRWGHVALSLTVILAAVGCENTIKPFSLTVGDVEEPYHARDAQILFSYPRVYARETLINDRLKEIEYLVEALDGTKTQGYGPELKRELESISAIAVQLRAGFNPAAGAAFRDADSLNEIKQEIDETKLRIQLEAVQRQLDNLRETPGVVDANDDDGSGTGLPEDSTKVPEAATADLKAGIEELKTTLKTLANSIKVGASGVGLTPEETYRRRRDHRAEIRADLAASRLDDVHNANGNALYRTQFLASIIPPSGTSKNRWGVARMHISPPKLDRQDIQSLYYDWLSHITNRLNRVRAEKDADDRYTTPRELSPDALYARLGENTDLYYVARINLYENCTVSSGKNANCYLPIAVPSHKIRKFISHPINVIRNNLMCIQRLRDVEPTQSEINPLYSRKTNKNTDFEKHKTAHKDKQTFMHILSDGRLSDGGGKNVLLPHINTLIKNLTKTNGSLKNSVISDSQSDDEEDDICRDFRTGQKIDPQKISSFINALIEFGPVVQAAHRALAERVELPGKTRRKALELLDDFDRAVANAGFIFSSATETTRTPDPEVPTEFCRLLSGVHCPKNDTSARANGDSFAVAITPSDEAQRVSTLQRAAHAMQLALGLAATVPQSGLNFQGGLNYLNAAAGSIDALERVPRVIGFTGRTPDDSQVDQTAAFGWLFGPEVTVDSKNNQLRLRQTAMDRLVTADLSVPGWWPRMTLNVETVWGGRLDDLKFSEKELNTSAGSQEFTVELPLNSADLDGLTGLLARKSGYGSRQQVRIDSVEPERITKCTNNVSMVIQGSGLWREPRAFLNGIPHKDTATVLPDMGGVHVVFDLTGLEGQFSSERRPMLTVWTRGGEARWPMEVACKKTGQSPAEAFKVQVAKLSAAATGSTKTREQKIAALLKRIGALDGKKDEVKKLKARVEATKKTLDATSKAATGTDKNPGFKQIEADAAKSDVTVRDRTAELQRATILGEPTAALKLVLEAAQAEGKAHVERAKTILTAYRKALDGIDAELDKTEGDLANLEQAAKDKKP